MSQSLNHITRIASLTIFVVFSNATGLLAGEPNHCPSFYSTAIRMMRIFYPEITEKSVTVDVFSSMLVEDDGPPLAFQISISETPPTEPIAIPPNPSSAQRVGRLSAHFEFDGRDERIHLIFLHGSLVNEEKRQALSKLIDEHPEWGEKEMTDALVTMGATYGPNEKEAVLARFPVKALEGLVGKIHITSIKFNFRDNPKPPFQVRMDWTIRFQVAIGPHRDEYFVSLEPFGGKVTMLGRRRMS